MGADQGAVQVVLASCRKVPAKQCGSRINVSDVSKNIYVSAFGHIEIVMVPGWT